MLHLENELATESYKHVIRGKKEVAKEIIPQQKKTNRKQTSEDARVQNVRKDMQNMFSMYENHPSNTIQDNLRKAKTKLQEAYDAVTEEEVSKTL